MSKPNPPNTPPFSRSSGAHRRTKRRYCFSKPGAAGSSFNPDLAPPRASPAAAFLSAMVLASIFTSSSETVGVMRVPPLPQRSSGPPTLMPVFHTTT